MINTYQLDKNHYFVFVNAPYAEHENRPYLSVVTEPPTIPEGKVAKWETALNPVTDESFGAEGTGEWALYDDNREKTLYNTADGTVYQGDYDGIGNIPAGTTLVAPLEEGMSWNGTEWVLTTEQPALKVANAKRNKLAEINLGASAYANAIAKLDETPEFERSTWQMQADEAMRWHEDNTVDTPILAIIASNRGVPLNILRQRAYQKATNFYSISASLAGQRQRYEDLLEQAETLEEVENINPVYQVYIESEEDDEFIEQEV